jgi:hypothetical protein
MPQARPRFVDEHHRASKLAIGYTLTGQGGSCEHPAGHFGVAALTRKPALG